MIGKPEWFTYRIFGWGLRPRTKEGWFYIIGFLALFYIVSILPLAENIRMIVFAVLFALIIIDTVHMMTQLSKVHDERENMQQLIIERNASFGAIAAIIGVAAYQAYKNKAILSSGALPFDWSLIVVLGVMLAVKIGSTIYVNKKM